MPTNTRAGQGNFNPNSENRAGDRAPHEVLEETPFEETRSLAFGANEDDDSRNPNRAHIQDELGSRERDPDCDDDNDEVESSGSDGSALARAFLEMMKTVTRTKSKEKNKYKSIPKSVVGPPVTQIGSGLKTRHVARNDAEMEDKMIALRREDRGTTPKEKAKSRSMICTELPTKLVSPDYSAILSGNGAGIADATSSWQDWLDSLHKRILKFDMKAVFMIPAMDFNPFDVCSVDDSKWIYLIRDWSKIKFEKICNWQHYLSNFASDEDNDSNEFCLEIIEKSTDPSLLAQVKADYNKLSEPQRGAATLFKLLISKVIVKSHSAKEALHNYLLLFDITTFVGENVSVAAQKIKAVAEALGPRDLPTNVIKPLLEGFSKASCPTFVSFCSTLSATQRAVPYWDAGNVDALPTSAMQDIYDMLSKVEGTYLDLTSTGQWTGAKAEGKSLFPAQATPPTSPSVPTSDAPTPRPPWQRNVSCRYCKKRGHLERECRKKAYAEKKKNDLKRQKHDVKTPKSTPTQKDRLKQAYKAMLAAFDSEESEEESHKSSDNESNHNSDDDDETIAHANIAAAAMNALTDFS